MNSDKTSVKIREMLSDDEAVQELSQHSFSSKVPNDSKQNNEPVLFTPSHFKKQLPAKSRKRRTGTNISPEKDRLQRTSSATTAEMFEVKGFTNVSAFGKGSSIRETRSSLSRLQIDDSEKASSGSAFTPNSRLSSVKFYNSHLDLESSLATNLAVLDDSHSVISFDESCFSFSSQSFDEFPELSDNPSRLNDVFNSPRSDIVGRHSFVSQPSQSEVSRSDVGFESPKLKTSKSQEANKELLLFKGSWSSKNLLRQKRQYHDVAVFLFNKEFEARLKYAEFKKKNASKNLLWMELHNLVQDPNLKSRKDIKRILLKNQKKSRRKYLKFLNNRENQLRFGAVSPMSYTETYSFESRLTNANKLFFYPQKMNWICGYLNIAMLLSSLLLFEPPVEELQYSSKEEAMVSYNLLKSLIVPCGVRKSNQAGKFFSRFFKAAENNAKGTEVTGEFIEKMFRGHRKAWNRKLEKLKAEKSRRRTGLGKHGFNLNLGSTRKVSLSKRNCMDKVKQLDCSFIKASRNKSAREEAGIRVELEDHVSTKGICDVFSFQLLIERAWELGFDGRHGSECFGGTLAGKSDWIGTNEARVLLRSFGIRAVTVDFDFTNKNKVCLNKKFVNKCTQYFVPDRKLNQGDDEKVVKSQGNGRYNEAKTMEQEQNTGLTRKKKWPEELEKDAKIVRKVKSESTSSFELSEVFFLGYDERELPNYSLVEFCWNYFDPGKTLFEALKLGTRHKDQFFYLERYKCSRRFSFITPLYLQHQGHSRTIVGMERIVNEDSQRFQTFFLLLDPAMKEKEVQRSHDYIRKPAGCFCLDRYQLVLIADLEGDRGILTKKEIALGNKLGPIRYLS